MSVLSSLRLVAVKKPAKQPPVLQRRNKLSTKIWEQLQLAEAHKNGETYSPMRTKSIRDRETGLRRDVTVPKRVKPWWFVAENGKVCVSIKYGSRVLELAKGKTSVEVNGPDELINTLQSIKEATEAGELDSQITAAASSLKEGFQK
jgi:hypothetical protein